MVGQGRWGRELRGKRKEKILFFHCLVQDLGHKGESREGMTENLVQVFDFHPVNWCNLCLASQLLGCIESGEGTGFRVRRISWVTNSSVDIDEVT